MVESKTTADLKYTFLWIWEKRNHCINLTWDRWSLHLIYFKILNIRFAKTIKEIMDLIKVYKSVLTIDISVVTVWFVKRVMAVHQFPYVYAAPQSILYYQIYPSIPILILLIHDFYFLRSQSWTFYHEFKRNKMILIEIISHNLYVITLIYFTLIIKSYQNVKPCMDSNFSLISYNNRSLTITPRMTFNTK